MRILIILLLFSSFVKADQLSYQEGAGLHDTLFYAVSTDRKLQYNFGNETYKFIRYQELTVRPFYGGIDYTAIGVGIGKNYKMGTFTLFAQAGFCFIQNGVGKRKFHEPTYYDFNYRFNYGNEKIRFISYEVENDNAISATLGVDMPFTKTSGIKVAYQYLKVREKRTAVISKSAYWEDNEYRDLSTLNIGAYVNF